ncbi:TetR/AcrR family transcriptional regulator [Pseudonocardia sp. RS11V-5]|uniref:TetR/AcrR family transcriptional regulator n=1 Tax=Pseudonocardia terrae TaxID=2905831 RepID=UPI001E3264B1|nr:TetR/AcrR family transcriptional regulator [Pseudonocardia terrae]MCE3555112.1 TetR/AcrR family transcriptional regulator [Pseudonocardia terrae]
MDARRRRSRDRLHGAVLELARDTPVADLTITQLAEAAGVHRSTFYEHAPSPGDLLRDALRAELDELRAGLLDDPGDTEVAVREVTRRVLEHVRRHAAIYRRGLARDSGPGSLHGMLSEHFLETSRRLIGLGRLRLPLHVAGVPDQAVADTAARFVAQGTVGAIQGWLDLPGEPEVAVFEDLYRVLVPSWWVRG